MKEIHIKDYNLVMGGVAPALVAAGAGATTGIATYLSTQAMGDQDPTVGGFIGAAVGGAVGGMVGSKVGSAIGGSILSASLGGMTDGVINSMYKDIEKSGNKLEEDNYNN